MAGQGLIAEKRKWYPDRARRKAAVRPIRTFASLAPMAYTIGTVSAPATAEKARNQTSLRLTWVQIFTRVT